MCTVRDWNGLLSRPATRCALELLYGPDLAGQVARFCRLLTGFETVFEQEAPAVLFSTPGRTELCGNHTDHQHGHAAAASVDLDTIAAVRPTGKQQIRIISEGHRPDCVDLSCLDAQPGEAHHAASLIRGVAARFRQLGYQVSGFDAYTTSRILSGSGLSSSAAFEVLVGTILNHLYNGASIPALEIAKIGQYAENHYFGKPSGLMDQIACSHGGAICLDFKNSSHPDLVDIPFDPEQHGYALCVLDTGASHADLTDEYAAIPAEMRAVASCLGVDFLCQAKEASFYEQLPLLRQTCGDRAVLRAYHYFQEDKRVSALFQALSRKDFSAYLSIVRDSGRSSWMFLQNIYPSGAVRCQDIAFALMLCERLLGQQGAARVHGGGLAGTVQAYVPLDMLERFTQQTESVFGFGRCRKLRVRSAGSVCITAL